MHSSCLRLDSGLTALRLSIPRTVKPEHVASASYKSRIPLRLCPSIKYVRAQYAKSSIDSPSQRRVDTVGEVMTTGVIYTVTPDTPVLEALELVVEKRITGLPVVDEDGKVVGVVSDFDLLAIDLPTDEQRTMFPTLEQSWEAFNDLRTVVSKSEGRVVEDVMTPSPIVVRAETSIHSAAKLLLTSKTRRLPVVDAEGKLIGVLTRRDIVTAALNTRKEHPEYFLS